MRLKEIRKEVEKRLDVDLRNPRRFSHIVLSRSVYYKLSKEYTGATLFKIGKVVGVHHATVLHGLSSTFEYSQTFPEYRETYNDVKEMIRLKYSRGKFDLMV